jgi:alpha-ketoglutarate-dependent taurine dioxygenase
MMNTTNSPILLQPFGAEFISPSPRSLLELDVGRLRTWLLEHRLVLLRNFRAPSDEEMKEACQRLGTILEWEFGAVNELKVRADSKNYLYTNRAVPFHWDGAFAEKVPHYIFFHCELAPPAGSGGETLFADTTKMLQQATGLERKTWNNISVTYQTEKIVHYGGKITAKLVDRHPVTRETILRFAEPVDDLNPVALSIHDLPETEHRSFLTDMAQRLRSPNVCITHQWRTGDIVIADNHALLHGRHEFTQPAQRHLRRVNIL